MLIVSFILLTRIIMNKTLKKIFLYFAVSWALILTILWLIAVWWNIDKGVVWRTFLTYIVLFIAFLSISGANKMYDNFKNYVEYASIWNWLLTISIVVTALIICIWIWDTIFDWSWKIIVSLMIINFATYILVFSMNKWWSNSSENKSSENK